MLSTLEYQQCVLKLEQFENSQDRERIQKAYDVARKAHEGQRRKSGEEYFCHPVAVANILMKVGVCANCIMAALLHDTVEDTDLTLLDIEKEFGNDVAFLVDGMTKLGKTKFNGMTSKDHKTESLRKWFEVLRVDIRIGILKLADRLHNVLTLEGHNNVQKQKDIAQKTIEIYARMAELMCILDWRDKLQDASFKHLLPEDEEKMRLLQVQLNIEGEEVTRLVKETLGEGHDILNIYYKTPSLYGLYQKVQELESKGADVGSLPQRVVIIASNAEACYRVLYQVHDKFRREKGSFEDFINTPKNNGYRALHTKIILPDGNKVDIYIRTGDMDDYAHYGIITELYSDHDETRYLQWLTHLDYVIDSTKESSEKFLQALEHDVFQDSIVVHGPDDGVLLLPEESTVLDAAFFLYGKEAFQVEKAFINGRKVPLFAAVTNGVKVHFKKGTQSVLHYNWLSWVDTILAQSVIKKELTKKSEEEKLTLGKELIEEVFMGSYSMSFSEIGAKAIKDICRHFKVRDKESLCIKVAEGSIRPLDVLRAIAPQRKTSKGEKFTIVLERKGGGFFDEVQNVFRKFEVEWTKMKKLTAKTGEPLVRIEVHLHETCTIEDLLKSLERLESVSIRSHVSKKEERNEFLMFLFLVPIWSLDPVVAKYLVNTIVDPVFLGAMRLWAGFLVLNMIGLSIVHRRKWRFASLPGFQGSVVIAGVSLLVLGMSSYLALTNLSPFVYNAMMGVVSVSFLFSYFYQKRMTREVKIFIGIAAVSGLISACLIGMYDGLETLGYILLAMAAFMVYFIFSERYIQKEQVNARLPQALGWFHLFGGVAAMIVVPFLIPFNSINLTAVVASALFVALFSVVPYLIWWKLKIARDSRIFLYYLLVLAVTLGTEVLVFHVTPGPLEYTVFALVGVIVAASVKLLQKN